MENYNLPVWPDLAKFSHKNLAQKNFGDFERVHLALSKIWRLLWQDNVIAITVQPGKS